MRHVKAVVHVLVTAAGILLLSIWMLFSGNMDATPGHAPENMVAGLPAPLIIISPSDDLTAGDDLRQELRALRVGANGGVLVCGPATLVFPPHSVRGEATFWLEDFSTHMPCVKVMGSADALAHPTQLHLSYRGTPYDGSGFDLTELKIYRQVSETEYQPMPGYVDIERRCVVAEVTQEGMYIIA